ncbi:hypothetical protein CLERM_242 [Coxiella-like endosymbiont]|nr:hypothetical protein CLERM_242 [Coxiella-like endosymbiont]
MILLKNILKNKYFKELSLNNYLMECPVLDLKVSFGGAKLPMV